MALISWSDKYSVGVSEMDSHHKKLLEMINSLHDAMKQGKSKEVLSKTVKELLDYTDFHFKKEEDYMKKYKYSGLSEQLNQHKFFVDKIKKFQDDLNSGKLTLSIEVMNFLRDWLINHIQILDKKYSDLFNEHGLK